MQRFVSTLHFSKHFTAIQLIILLGSMASILYLPWGWLNKALLIGMVIGYGIFNFYRQNAWDAIGHDADGWFLRKNDTQTGICLAGDSTVTPWMTVLRFHYTNKRRVQSYMIFKDAMPEEVYRQFIVRLRYFLP